MKTFATQMKELDTFVNKKGLRESYQELMHFLMALRLYFDKKYSKYNVSKQLYQGYLDMSYFAVTPPFLKEKGLKMAIVFNFESFHFEGWLVGRNKKVQAEYVDKLSRIKGLPYPVKREQDAILSSVLSKRGSFENQELLTEHLDKELHIMLSSLQRYIT